MRRSIRDEIAAFKPYNEQEEKDKVLILDFLDRNPDAFLRSNRLAHMTASAWIVNPARSKVLMVYHRLYDSWSWTGGHADGETDLLAVALREVREETGLRLDPDAGRLLFQFSGDHYLCDTWLFEREIDLDEIVLRPGETCGKRLADADTIRALNKAGEFFAFEDLERVLAWEDKRKIRVESEEWS